MSLLDQHYLTSNIEEVLVVFRLRWWGQLGMLWTININVVYANPCLRVLIKVFIHVQFLS
jgi:hypothetical protein